MPRVTLLNLTPLKLVRILRVSLLLFNSEQWSREVPERSLWRLLEGRNHAERICMLENTLVDFDNEPGCGFLAHFWAQKLPS